MFSDISVFTLALTLSLQYCTLQVPATALPSPPPPSPTTASPSPSPAEASHSPSPTPASPSPEASPSPTPASPSPAEASPIPTPASPSPAEASPSPTPASSSPSPVEASPSPAPASSRALTTQDYISLAAGVGTVSTSSWSASRHYLFGPAMAIVNIGGTTPIVSATVWGDGVAIHFGHEGMLGACCAATGLGRLLLNAAEWAAGAPSAARRRRLSATAAPIRIAGYPNWVTQGIVAALVAKVRWRGLQSTPAAIWFVASQLLQPQFMVATFPQCLFRPALVGSHPLHQPGHGATLQPCHQHSGRLLSKRPR